jgi:membrane-anchored glycerophosphoryl diester phosphodiesterase (GDPDase)
MAAMIAIIAIIAMAIVIRVIISRIISGYAILQSVYVDAIAVEIIVPSVIADIGTHAVMLNAIIGPVNIDIFLCRRLVSGDQKTHSRRHKDTHNQSGLFLDPGFVCGFHIFLSYLLKSRI